MVIIQFRFDHFISVVDFGFKAHAVQTILTNRAFTFIKICIYLTLLDQKICLPCLHIVYSWLFCHNPAGVYAVPETGPTAKAFYTFYS